MVTMPVIHNLKITPIGDICAFCEGVAYYEISNPQKACPVLVPICKACVKILEHKLADLRT